MRPLTRQALMAAFAICCSWLAGCAVAPPEPPAAPMATERALAAEAAGQYALAAELWTEAAQEAAGPAQAAYRLRAVEAWFAAGDIPETRRLHGQIDRSALSSADQSRHALLGAELALLRADAEAATAYLQAAAPRLEPGQRARYRQIEDSVRRLRADPASLLLSRIARALGDLDPVDPEQVSALLSSLDPLPSSLLEQAAGQPAQATEAGSWAALALSIRRHLVSGENPGVAAVRWAADYPGHAVTASRYVQLARDHAQRYPAPRRVAVLLPMAGGLAPASLAIRDGLLGAYLERPRGSTLTLYDSGDSPGSALQAYARALADGADWVIGPVRRESAQAVADMATRALPTLLLNEVSGNGPPAAPDMLYSLSLSQEDEARIIAHRMRDAGMHRVIALTSLNTWGTRMERAFVEAFEAGGGSILEVSRFPIGQSDHSVLLTQALQIDQSQQRKQRLQDLLGQVLEFEPHRRDDFDAFFLSAGPEQARQIRPQIRFFEAGEIPVFAMSRVFSGMPDRNADQDLNGIILPLTQVQLAAIEAGSLPALESLRGGSLASLYALGVDAWNLLPWLPLLSSDPDLAFPGAVGHLRVSAAGRLAREPAWAIFDGGRPTRMQWPEVAE